MLTTLLSDYDGLKGLVPDNTLNCRASHVTANAIKLGIHALSGTQELTPFLINGNVATESSPELLMVRLPDREARLCLRREIRGR